MGDIKKTKKKYLRPKRPFSRKRIEDEKILVKEYGLKNKKEIWRLVKMLKSFKDQAKKTITNPQIEKERVLLFRKLESIGLLKSGASEDNILGLQVKDLLERRLQTIVFRRCLCHSIKQARQFIVHEHISVGDKMISRPSYIVKVFEEPQISYSNISPLSNPEHAERVKKDDKATA